MRVVRSVRERESRTSLRCRNRVRLFQNKRVDGTRDFSGAGGASSHLRRARRGAVRLGGFDARILGLPLLAPRRPRRGFHLPGGTAPQETQISERSCPFGSESKWTSFRKNKSRGKRAKAANPGFVEPSRGDVEKGSVSRPLFPRERRREAAGRSRRALREAQPADVRGFAPESHRPS